MVFDDDIEGKSAHSETVVKNEDGTVTVEGLGGMQTETSTKNVDKAWPNQNKRTYYEKPKKDRKMSEKDIEEMKKYIENILNN